MKKIFASLSFLIIFCFIPLALFAQEEETPLPSPDEEVIKEKVASSIGLFNGVHGICPLNGFSGMSPLMNSLRAGGMKRKPSTIFPSAAISYSPFSFAIAKYGMNIV